MPRLVHSAAAFRWRRNSDDGGASWSAFRKAGLWASDEPRKKQVVLPASFALKA